MNTSAEAGPPNDTKESEGCKACRSGHCIALGLILLAALVFRVNDLNQPFVDTFSWRQASTAMMADTLYHGETTLLKPAVRWGGEGLSYQGREFQSTTFLIACLYRVFGQHEWVGRAVPVVFGVWGVFALYLLVARVWGTRHGLLAAFFLAVLPGAVFVDRSLLPDGPSLALAITSLWLATRYVDRGGNGLLLGVSAVAAMAFLTKLPAITSLPALAYCALVSIRSADRRLPAAGRWALAGLAALVPVVAYYQWAVYLGTHYPPYHVAGQGNWIWDVGFLHTIASGFYIEATVSRFAGLLWTLPVLVLVLIGLLFAPARGDGGEERANLRWIFHLWAAGWLVMFLIGGRELSINYWNLHSLNAAAAAFAARGLLLLGSLGGTGSSFVSRIPWREATLCILVAGMGWRVVGWLKHPHAIADYRMGLAVRELSGGEGLAMVAGSDIGDPISLYYSGLHGWTFPRSDSRSNWSRVPDPGETREQFEVVRDLGADWFAIAKDGVGERGRSLYHDDPAFIAHLRGAYTVARETDRYLIFALTEPGNAGDPPPPSGIENP